MKKYIDQIFYEGLGATLYKPLENVLKKTKNNSLRDILIIIIKVLYFIFSITLAIMILKYKL